MSRCVGIRNALKICATVTSSRTLASVLRLYLSLRLSDGFAMRNSVSLILQRILFCQLILDVCELDRRARRTLFDPEALERIACNTVSAQRCLSWTKIGEGMYVFSCESAIIY